MLRRSLIEPNLALNDGEDMTDWAPVWDYQWWKDIAIPGISAFGAVGVGIGSVWLANRSRRFVADANSREEAARERERAAAEQKARANAVRPIHAWIEGYWAFGDRLETDARRIEVSQATAATPRAGIFMDSMEDLAMQRKNISEQEELAQCKALLRHFVHAWVKDPGDWTRIDATDFASDSMRKRAEGLVARWSEQQFDPMEF